MAKFSEMFENKLILAPMVRVGTLPMRLLALKYGADLVYTEEIIDYKLLSTKRVENKLFGTTDFVGTDGTVVFRTCPLERNNVILQMGTSCAERAFQVAKLLEDIVAGIDINMGCPKEFSIKGGMGCALLNKPETAFEILSTLVHNLKIPVTCKIRVLENEEDTFKLVRKLESAGIAAICVHGRKKYERPRHPNNNTLIMKISKLLSIPVIANGGSIKIKTYKDIHKFKYETGCNSVMLARVAQWNPSIFTPGDKLVDPLKIADEYLKLAVDYNQHAINVKFVVLQFLHDQEKQELAEKLMACGLLNEICELFNLQYYIDKIKEEKQKFLIEKNYDKLNAPIKRKIHSGDGIIEADFKFIKKAYFDNKTPKQILYEYCKKNGWPKPVYQTVYHEKTRLYESTVNVNNQKYKSTNLVKSKKFAEQASASVCLQFMNIEDGRKPNIFVM